MKKIYIMLVIFTLGNISFSHVYATETINWLSYDAGMKIAKEENKNIFVFFQNKTCKYCEKMKKNAFKKEEVIAFLNQNYISISVDTLEEKDIAKKYLVRPIPVSLFLKPDGSEIKKRLGYISPKQFLKLITKIDKKNPTN